jgi:hypothetical protein
MKAARIRVELGRQVGDSERWVTLRAVDVRHVIVVDVGELDEDLLRVSVVDVRDDEAIVEVQATAGRPAWTTKVRRDSLVASDDGRGCAYVILGCAVIAGVGAVAAWVLK